MIDWKIGCSGFSYYDWKEVFYPKDLPRNKWFDYYSDQFNTLELNVTFYKFPRLSFLEGWYNKSNEQFKFSVKAPQAITHFKKFTETAGMLSDFYGTTSEGLKEKLGCVLFQLPPAQQYSKEHLEKITSSLDPSFTNVVEFRHESWWNEEVYKVLAEHKITFCGSSHSKVPDTVICNSPVLYYRFHGAPILYKSEYQENKLIEIADQIVGCKNVKKAYVYFNNTWGVAGINNARQMEKYVELLFTAKEKGS
jgi:uncharacterized protein YecE (DUF72 family)